MTLARFGVFLTLAIVTALTERALGVDWGPYPVWKQILMKVLYAVVGIVVML